MSEHEVRNRIREFRQQRTGMTQAQLADDCGVTRQTIIALEAGKYAPSLELAFKLARALERNLEDIFQYEKKS
jgi:putative transcriptional regulator